jgi:hypothetical protein
VPTLIRVWVIAMHDHVEWKALIERCINRITL